MKNLFLLSLLILLSISSFAQTFNLYFKSDKYRIENKYKNQVKEFLQKNKALEVNISGYADTLGAYSYNKKLAQNRLESVKKLLLNIDKNITINNTNNGEKRSLSGDLQYRKVEIHITKKDETNFSFSLCKEKNENTNTYEEVYVIAENMPSFEGGDISKFKKYIKSKIQYPYIAYRNGIESNINIMFKVNKNGKISKISIPNKEHPSFIYEIIKVFNSTPKWEPATHNGKVVDLFYTIDLQFKINNEIIINKKNNIDSEEKLKDKLSKIIDNSEI
ncbi:MAG: OmpA family protein [Marinifilaceae bacterium]|jgi:hypothetical protein|nr:OmpA family protein [Marinifilaceae bacterium]